MKYDKASMTTAFNAFCAFVDLFSQIEFEEDSDDRGAVRQIHAHQIDILSHLRLLVLVKEQDEAEQEAK